ncbi:MAG: putative baseplate assembly protein [Rhizomicrobium sp.]
MGGSELDCKDSGGRRRDVRATKLMGLDFVEVSDDQLGLDVFFLGRAPAKLEAANVKIGGGRSITGITVKSITVTYQKDKHLDDVMEVVLANYGDFSTYTLSLVKTDRDGNPTDEPLGGFDPFYASVDFSFKASCPTDLDCKPEAVCPPPLRQTPEINYLAKDYASFRQLILDRMAVTLPDWNETHVPDIGITLVELLAYAGDHLSYYQDAVATEAYLGTARQRISVRRHARLVDYAMHEGCNARAWVTVATDAPATLEVGKFFFCTAFTGAPDNSVLQPVDIANAAPGSYEIFAPLLPPGVTKIDLYPAHTAMVFYTWGNRDCCLPKGASSATLEDTWVAIAPAPVPAPAPSPDPAPQKPAQPATDTPLQSADKTAPESQPVVAAATTPVKSKTGEPPNALRTLALKVGDVLIFEEVVGPKTGNRADANPKNRQAVRLTRVTPVIDPLYHPFSPDYGQPVVEIEWCSEDALQFPFCISARMPDCSWNGGISVAHGNVILVNNSAPSGETVGTVGVLRSAANCPTDCEPREIVVTPAKFRTALKQTGLSFSQPLPECCCADRALLQDPRQALPRLSLSGAIDTANGVVTTSWTARADLLESGPDDCDFVVEMDDAGFAHIRFGNGREGRTPDAGTTFTASYSVGNGPSGNVGAESITYIAFTEVTGNMPRLRPRNPFAAQGGTAPEPVVDVKQFAPYAFRDTLERAITADDYTAIAGDNVRRLDERPRLALLAAAEAVSPVSTAPPGPGPNDARADDQEEEGPETPPLPPDLCLIPFEPLQRAKTALRWTGSWYEAHVCLDPLGLENADDELCAEIDAYLEPYRRIGHDLAVRPARYAPLDIALSVCVGPQSLRGQVEGALLDIFSDRVLPGGKLGFFHPDNLSFGSSIFASRIVAAAQAVNGVTEIRLLRLARYEPGAPPARAPRDFKACPEKGDSPAMEVLKLAPFEIATLDNDPSSPGKGRLTLYLRGGR